MRRIVALLLASLMLLTLFAGCQKKSDGNSDTQQGTEGMTSAPVKPEVKILVTMQADPHERLEELAADLKDHLAFFGYTVEVAEDNGARADEGT